MKNLISVICALFFVLQLHSKSKPVYVEITTSKGIMIVKLYDETPLHKENFIKLVKSNFYDSCNFHRVIKDFMIQGGDPTSKPSAGKKVQVGNGGPGYTIPAEFNEKLFHKKGVIAAARLGDDVNPKKESSGSQFYIVQGKVFDDEMLNYAESARNKLLKAKLIPKILEDSAYIELKAKMALVSNGTANDEVQKEVLEEMEQALLTFPEYKPIRYSPEIIEAYKTLGGTPHLDGNYTVFGELVSGFEVLDAIVSVSVTGSTPNEPVYMQMKILKRWKPAKEKRKK